MIIFFYIYIETSGTDSAYAELSDESKSASTSSDATNLTSSSRIDSTSDDTGCP